MKLNHFAHKVTLSASLFIAFVSNSFADTSVLYFGDTAAYGSAFSTLNAPITGDPSTSNWTISLLNSSTSTLSASVASTYDVVVIGWTTDNSRLTGFSSALDPSSSRILITSQDGDYHSDRGDKGGAFDGPKGFLRNAVNWAAGGSSTGYVFLNMGPYSYSSVLTAAASSALGTISVEHQDDVRIPTAVAGHAINQNLTTAGLTGWGNSSHGKATGINLAYWTGISTVGASTTDFVTLISAFTGPSAADTQSSLQRLASGLRNSYNHQALTSNFPNSNTYDCNLFDVKGMCISAGGRYSTVDNPNSNSTAAVVTLGYKVNPNIRIGGFLDQSVNNSNPTGINVSNKNPMMGVFAYWNQNADGLGYQVKVANAFQDKDLSTTRDVIGTSEAGTGKTSLNTTSYLSELSYAFMYKENTLVRPYFALRYTTIEQDAYTETGVSTPLTYSALNDRTTSALMGVKFKHALTPKANLIGSLGVEQDLNHKTDRLTASGVSGLTSENFSGNLHHTRPVASLGATYDIAKSQRLSGEVLVQQLPFQSTAGATAYFNYMIGF